MLVTLAVTPRIAAAQRWQDATASCLGTTAEWSNKIEVADVDGDGLVDILIANGGNYASPGSAEPVRIWKNLGGWGSAGAHCTEISAEAVAGFTGLSRVVKAVDLDGDGDLDIITGGAYQTQLKLFLRGATTWSDATAQLPQQLTSIGDLEAGDVDGDGDLDLVMSDWGGTNPQTNAGGRTRLYLNDGHGTFTEATSDHMPATLMKWSWEIELADVDGDWDLDILIACKLCTTSYLFRNDGTGHFTNDANALPHFSNNYDFEPMDIDGDGDLDLVTINDGPMSRNHIFVNDGAGKFADETSTRLTGTANPGADDNVAAWVDVDNDGDADLLIGSLGPDRLLLNDGAGHFTLAPDDATPDDTPGSLGIALADFDGDGRLDVVQAQGEVAFPDKLQLASDMVAIDTSPPVVIVEQLAGPAGGVIHARVHDHHSPSRAHDWKRVWIEHNGVAAAAFESGPPPLQDADMTWYGEYLWASPRLDGVTSYRVCAADRRNNQGCSEWISTLGGDHDGSVGQDAGTDMTPGGGGGGCCEAGQSPRGAIVPLGLVLVLRRRRASGARRRS